MAGLLLLLAATHFVLIVAWLVPGPAVPAGLRATASAWVAPLFTQNWWLFAPDPPPLDRRVHVRGFYDSAGVRRTTPWLPLTDSLSTRVRRNPLSSAHAAWIVVLNATYALTGPSGPLALREPARRLVIGSWSAPERRPPALVVLDRTGALALAAAYPRKLEQVQVRITVRPLPPMGDRADRRAGGQVLLFPPVPFPEDLERAGGW